MEARRDRQPEATPTRYRRPRVGILAVQGAFAEHRERLQRLGATCVELRQASDLDISFDQLVLPGGESTAQGKLLDRLGMLATLQRRIEEGMPVLGTCAGMILLAKAIDEQSEQDHPAPRLKTMDIAVTRNAFGRQLASFRTEEDLHGCGRVPMTFIRAPYVHACGPSVEVLAEIDGRIVAAREKNQIALAFHPELDPDDSIHRWFLRL
ncbi:pyridoxal 5'-phosphate synthase glutaminase subunit PdxT [Eggerthellaceae bacterium zg-887]|uniref:pyridoxal 5'-phosphate synthase glutaminase subunit PdxT n=1 Tax=Xiamenia xianingshaonis TaxID=2682776 RepID=UPI00140B1D51|nr:pyridoxal 5'-phosphate synthase glutaminase subunit PdxT [Xiamenia xianingshaonis]NHM15329.1 pyridoxal 5'-phosphate synthase glutaminase subunit PdxT [Xiamenia xianingshaonis]